MLSEEGVVEKAPDFTRPVTKNLPTLRFGQLDFVVLSFDRISGDVFCQSGEFEASASGRKTVMLGIGSEVVLSAPPLDLLPADITYWNIPKESEKAFVIRFLEVIDVFWGVNTSLFVQRLAADLDKVGRLKERTVVGQVKVGGFQNGCAYSA